jgi:6-phosphogluconolactonase
MGLLSGGVNGPLALALSPNSDFLAAGNLNGGGISVFRVSKTTGSLTPVSNSPFPTGGSGFPARGLFHTSGNFFYAGLQLSPTNEIAGFSVDPSTGALSPLPNSPFPGQPPIGGGGVNSVALHPSGGFLYVSGSFQGITGYSVDSAGNLAQLSGSPFAPAGAFPNSTLDVDSSGNFLYMADFDADGVRVFPIASDGTMGGEIAGSPFFSGTGAKDLALDPTGKFACVINDGDTNVTAFRVETSTGSLTFVGNTNTGVSPFGLTVDSSGKFLYVNKPK